MCMGRMKIGDLRKGSNRVIQALKSYSDWYGCKFTEMFFENLEVSGSEGYCSVSFSGMVSCKWVLSTIYDGFLLSDSGRRSLSIEEWSRLVGLKMRLLEAFSDMINLRWVYAESLIVIKRPEIYEGIYYDAEGKIEDILESTGN